MEEKASKYASPVHAPGVFLDTTTKSVPELIYACFINVLANFR